MSVREVEFFFDYSSPFAYLAATQMSALAERTGATVIYKPFLLGALFKQIGTPIVPIATYADTKRRYVEMDMQRWAKFRGVPLQFPSAFPLRTVDALRLTLALDQAKRPALVDRLMNALWALDEPPSQDLLRRICAELGEDPLLVDSLSDQREALREATDEALARGVPGAPTFFVDGEMFWGQDRLDWVERRLTA